MPILPLGFLRVAPSNRRCVPEDSNEVKQCWKITEEKKVSYIFFSQVKIKNWNVK